MCQRSSPHAPALLTAILLVSLVFSGCAPQPAAPPAPTRAPVESPTALPAPATPALTERYAAPTVQEPSSVPTAVSSATPVPAPAPELSLKPGQNYFSLGGVPQFIFSRNLAAYVPPDYATLLDWTRGAGSRMVRLNIPGIVMGGTGYNSQGELDEAWAKRWDKVFDEAEAHGIYVWVQISGWGDWKTTAPGDWAHNPFNTANGGPASQPEELFKPDSPTQKLWLAWLKQLVLRWKEHKAIVIWEPFAEVNLAPGATEQRGVEFVEKAVAVIRQNDPYQRLVTNSMGDVGVEWPSFFSSPALDFLNIHPYPPSAKLDSKIIRDVRYLMATYHKPVMIGESGLNADSPENYPPNAEAGLRHAVWAGLVSGSMNARSLFWEDAYDLFFPNLYWPYLRKYNNLELPAANFINGVDLTGVAPVSDQPSVQITGAAVGNEHLVIGWYRDIRSEPPDWPLQPLLSRQSVAISVPGSTQNWQVDFYNTRTGADILSSAVAARSGQTVVVSLPDFSDDIAFKMYPQGSPRPGASSVPVPIPPALTNTSPIAGRWSGTVTGLFGGFSAQTDLTIQPGCAPGSVCGTISVPYIPCAGNLYLQEIQADMFLFIEQDMQDAPSCVSGGHDFLLLQPDGSLSFRFQSLLPNGQADALNAGVLGLIP